MLNDYVSKLSKLISTPILTPYNLLENLELENYLSINYYKQKGNTVADIVFLVHDEKVVFRYIFDSENFLQKIYHVDGNNLITHFDRQKEKESLIVQARNIKHLKGCI